jgi:hypothetical protein
VLSLASAIFSIARKQVTLASLSQQSQYAFYAADTAAECALYWDVRYNYFATVTPSVTPMCDGSTLFSAPPYTVASPATYTPSTDPEYTTSFQLQLKNGYCANVIVVKCQGTLFDTGVCCPGVITNGSCVDQTITTISTQVRSNGFNTSCSSIGTNSTTLERSVELNY